MRLMLFAMLASVAFALALSEASNSVEVDKQIMLLIYALGSFLLLDFGYVMVARAYPIVKWLDVLTVAVLDMLVALIYIVPKVVIMNTPALRLDPMVYVFFIAIGAIAIRLLLGLLYSSGSSKKR